MQIRREGKRGSLQTWSPSGFKWRRQSTVPPLRKQGVTRSHTGASQHADGNTDLHPWRRSLTTRWSAWLQIRPPSIFSTIFIKLSSAFPSVEISASHFLFWLIQLFSGFVQKQTGHFILRHFMLGDSAKNKTKQKFVSSANLELFSCCLVNNLSHSIDYKSFCHVDQLVNYFNAGCPHSQVFFFYSNDLPTIVTFSNKWVLKNKQR